MTDTQAILWPTALFILGTLGIVGGTLIGLRYFVPGGQPRTRARGLLREPAASLRRRLEVVDFHLICAGVGLPLTLFLWTAFFPAGFDGADHLAGTIIYLAAGAIALGWFGRELIHYWPERIGLRRAIDAQARTAVSLNLLMRQKYWVLHDVHIGGYRINHLVIGPRGVFCVDSLWRRAVGRLSWKGREPAPPAEVRFDGETLQFPGWREQGTHEHPVEQAAWLGPWLAAQIGEPESEVPTWGAIALPGWQVVSTHWKRVMVFNPSTPNMLVEGAPEGRRIDATTMQALIKALKRGCETPSGVEVRHAERVA
jgi:hypothetical protein